MRKKYLIIFLGLIFLAILIYFAIAVINRNTGAKNNPQNINNPITTTTPTATLTTASSTAATSSQEINNASSTKVVIDVEAVNKKFLEYLPKTSAEELETFPEIAVTKDMSGCEKLSSDEIDSCKYYFSVYYNEDGVCGDMDNNQLKLDCYQKLIPENITSKTETCNKEQNINARFDCFDGVFWGVENVDGCNLFTDNSIHQICVDSLNLRVNLAKNKNICAEIKDTILKTFCDQYFAPADFDKDGLSDGEETKIGTNPYSADTDGDGYNDKDEIDKGYNPCGAGLKPSAAELLKDCAAFTKLN